MEYLKNTNLNKRRSPSTPRNTVGIINMGLTVDVELMGFYHFFTSPRYSRDVVYVDSRVYLINELLERWVRQTNNPNDWTRVAREELNDLLRTPGRVYHELGERVALVDGIY